LKIKISKGGIRLPFFIQKASVPWGSPADKKNAMRFKRAFLHKRQVHCRFFYNEKRRRNKNNLRQNR
jgi:hypothetical protein